MRVGLPGDERDDDRRGRRSAPVTAPRWRASCSRNVRPRTSACSRSRATAGAARPYLAPADLAAAVAAAVEGWRADVVLIAMSDGAWGRRAYLRDVLREAARSGRGGRGTSIFCSVGDPSRNHARQDDSAALGADDLASQPWVHAIAACDRAGRLVSRLSGIRSVPGRRQRERRRRARPTTAWARRSRWPRSASRRAGASTSRPTIPARPPPLAAAAAARVLAGEPRPLRRGAARAAGADRRRSRRRRRRARARGRRVRRARSARPQLQDRARRRQRARRVPGGRGSDLPRAARDARGARPRAGRIAARWRCARGLAGGGAARGRAAATRSRAPTLRVAGRVSRLFLTSLPVQEALCLARAPRPGAAGSRPPRPVAAARITARWWNEFVTRSTPSREALGPDDGDTAVARCGAWKRRSPTPTPEPAVATFLASAFRPDGMAADGEKGESRAIALTGDAVGDRHRRRGPRRADRDRELERPPFARPDRSRAVHRSPR